MKLLKLLFSFCVIAFVFTCSSPQNPFTQDKAKVYLHLESSMKIASDSAITDTAGNIISIGISYFMSQYFDSVIITVNKSIQEMDTFFVCKKSDIKDDTAWFEYVFKSEGIRTITATGYVAGGYKPTATATITVIARPVVPVNHKPVLIVTGRKTITTAEACTLFVSVNDSDTAQAHSYQVLKSPNGYAFANQIFTWKPSPADTGIDSIVFTVADNGIPVLSDTQTIIVVISAPNAPINHKPSLVITGRKSITTAETCTLSVSANDEDTTQTLTFKILKGPQGYAFSNHIFVWKPTVADTGIDTVTFTVTDNGTPPLSDSQKVVIWVSINIPLPDSIKGLVAVSRINGTFVFRWNTSANADAYAIYRSADTSGFALYATIPDTFFSNTIKDTAFYYYVKAVNSKGSSPSSVRLHSTSINTAPKWVHDTLQINVLENTSMSLNLADSVADINGDKITFQRGGGNLTTDSLVGAIWKYSPSFNDSGKYAVKIKAFDGIDSSSVILSIHVANVNRPPIITGIKDTTVPVGALITLNIIASDPDGDSVTISGDTLPTGATFNSITGIFNWTPTNNQVGSNKVSFTATDGKSPTKKSIVITVSAVPLPTITLQPKNQTICSGLPDSFSVTATGPGTLKYQWQKNNVNIPGDTNKILRFSAVSANDSGSYSCVVSNAGGSTSSDSARLTVSAGSNPPTNVTSSSSSICSGSPDTLKIIGGKLGTGASWKWYTDSACKNAASGAFNTDKTQLTISPLSTTTYYVRAEGTCGNTIAVSAKILVYLSPAAADSISATRRVINSGDTVVLRVKGGTLGTGPGAAWKWYSGGCGGSVVGSTFEGTGDSLTVFPTATRAYFVRGESGSCGVTACASVNINVIAWTSASSGLPANTFVKTLVVSGTNMFAGTQNDSGVYLSKNNGDIWTSFNNGLPASTSVFTLAVSGSNIFAGTNSTSIYRNTLNGTNWTALNNGIPANVMIASLAVNGSNVFAGTNTSGIYYSSGNGDSWAAVNNGIPSTNIFSLATHSDTIFAGISGNSIYRSTNSGLNWMAANTGLPAGDVYAIAVNGNKIFAGVAYNGAYLSTSNGSSWNSANNGLPASSFITSFAMVGNFIFAGYNGGGVYFSADNGANWTKVSNGLPAITGIKSLAVGSGFLFAGTDNGVYRTPLTLQ